MRLTDMDRNAIKAMLVARPTRAAETGSPSVKKILKWPHYSDALGVTPSGIPQAMREMRKRGIALDFDRHGRAIITGPTQYSAVAKAAGLKSGRDGYETIRAGRESARGREALRCLLARHLAECEAGIRDEDSGSG